MFSKLLMLVGVMCVWSCSGDDERSPNAGGAGSGHSGSNAAGSDSAGSDSAGSGGRSQAGASGAGSGGHAGGGTAGHGGSASGGDMMGDAGEVAGGSGGLAGAGGAGLAGSGAGGGAAGSGENPYRACAGEDATDNSCPVSGSKCDADFGCQPPCPTGTVSCPAPLGGGTATVYCQQRFCRLDCGFGKTCPDGMTCDNASLFCTPNGP